ARTCTDDIEPPKDSHARCGTSEPDSTSGPDVELDAEHRRGDAPVRRTGDRRGARRREGSWAPPRRVRTLDLIKAKAEGRRWAMLTSYDQYTAALFEKAGVEAL